MPLARCAKGGGGEGASFGTLFGEVGPDAQDGRRARFAHWVVRGGVHEDPDSHVGPLMPAAAVPAGIVPPRPAWRALLWIVPLTALWIVLIYWQPIIPTSGVPTTAHQLMAHGFIAVGLWLGLANPHPDPGQRRTTWLAVIIP